MNGKSAEDIIQEEGLGQMMDDASLKKIVEAAVAANPKAVQNYKEGKTAAIGVIVGAVMKQTKGQADAATVNEILKSVIS
jgi:aspartyl-tRNA(Asn)/glutamyl-tRNA(Gln) amidotransferase subunit B